MQVRLTRTNSGYFVNICGVIYRIFGFVDENDRQHGWIIANTNDPYSYSDPIPTLKRVRLAIAEMMEYKAATQVWSTLIELIKLQREKELKEVASQPGSWFTADYVGEFEYNGMTKGWRYVGKSLYGGGFDIINDNAQHALHFVTDFTNFQLDSYPHRRYVEKA